MQRTAAIIAVVLAALSIQCEDKRVDDLYVCFIPPNCSCPDPTSFACEWECPEGQFPADASFRVVASEGEECDAPEEFECSVTQTGEFELTIHSEWQPPPSTWGCYGEDSIACAGFSMDCGETPTLAAGTWTVHYGESSREFVVPSPELTNPQGEAWNCFYSSYEATTGE